MARSLILPYNAHPHAIRDHLAHHLSAFPVSMSVPKTDGFLQVVFIGVPWHTNGTVRSLTDRQNTTDRSCLQETGRCTMEVTLTLRYWLPSKESGWCEMRGIDNANRVFMFEEETDAVN